MKINILSAKLRSTNAATAASNQPASAEPITVTETVEKKRLSAASLKRDAEDVQIEEAVQHLAKGAGITIGGSKPYVAKPPVAQERTPAPAKKRKKAKAKRTSTTVRKATPVAATQPKAAEMKPIAKPVTESAPKPARKELYIQDYSEKSFAVFGNTKPVKDELKRCGGRFNSCLHPFGSESCVPGWIFPMKARAEVEKIIG